MCNGNRLCYVSPSGHVKQPGVGIVVLHSILLLRERSIKGEPGTRSDAGKQETE